jgi:AcrR family transcriptional regulator
MIVRYVPGRNYLVGVRLSSEQSKRTPRRRLTAQARRELIEQAASELFADRGYGATSIGEVARRAGVTAPVVYDHFASKQDLHRRLLERHYAELRLLWREQLAGEDPPEQRISRAIDAWFAYVEAHPYAWRMLFRDTSGEPAVRALHEQVIAQSRTAIMPLFLRERGIEDVTSADADELGMAWEVMRGVLQGLALWWYEHQHVPREQIVATAMNALWIGFERVLAGEAWQGTPKA